MEAVIPISIWNKVKWCCLSKKVLMSLCRRCKSLLPSLLSAVYRKPAAATTVIRRVWRSDARREAHAHSRVRTRHSHKRAWQLTDVKLTGDTLTVIERGKWLSNVSCRQPWWWSLSRRRDISSSVFIHHYYYYFFFSSIQAFSLLKIK